MSSSPSYPAQTWCVFVQLGPKHNQPSAARRGEPGEDREGTKGKRGWKGEPLVGHKETLWVGGGVVVGGVVAGAVAAEGDEGEGE